jgi:arsenate reductase-like glutaredoxin family protein
MGGFQSSGDYLRFRIVHSFDPINVISNENDDDNNSYQFRKNMGISLDHLTAFVKDGQWAAFPLFQPLNKHRICWDNFLNEIKLKGRFAYGSKVYASRVEFDAFLQKFGASDLKMLLDWIALDDVSKRSNSLKRLYQALSFNKTNVLNTEEIRFWMNHEPEIIKRQGYSTNADSYINMAIMNMREHILCQRQSREIDLNKLGDEVKIGVQSIEMHQTGQQLMPRICDEKSMDSVTFSQRDIETFFDSFNMRQLRKITWNAITRTDGMYSSCFLFVSVFIYNIWTF